jgi:hypothetical protein
MKIMKRKIKLLNCKKKYQIKILKNQKKKEKINNKKILRLFNKNTNRETKKNSKNFKNIFKNKIKTKDKSS